MCGPLCHVSTGTGLTPATSASRLVRLCRRTRKSTRAGSSASCHARTLWVRYATHAQLPSDARDHWLRRFDCAHLLAVPRVPRAHATVRETCVCARARSGAARVLPGQKHVSLSSTRPRGHDGHGHDGIGRRRSQSRPILRRATGNARHVCAKERARTRPRTHACVHGLVFAAVPKVSLTP